MREKENMGENVEESENVIVSKKSEVRVRNVSPAISKITKLFEEKVKVRMRDK